MLDNALAKYQEGEEIGRRLQEPSILALHLINRAQLLADDLNRPAEALPLAEEALRTVATSGLRAIESQIRPIVESIRRQSHDRLPH